MISPQPMKNSIKAFFYPLFIMIFLSLPTLGEPPKMSPHTFMKHLEQGMNDTDRLSNVATMFDDVFFGHVGLEVRPSYVSRYLMIIQDIEKNLKNLKTPDLDTWAKHQIDQYEKNKQLLLKRLKLVHRPNTLREDDLHQCREDLELYLDGFLKQTLGRTPLAKSIKEKILTNTPLSICERARLYMLFPHRSSPLISIPEIAVLPLGGSDRKIILVMVAEDTGMEVQAYLWDQDTPEKLAEIRRVEQQAQMTLFMKNPENYDYRPEKAKWFTWDAKENTLQFPGFVWEQNTAPQSTSCTLTFDGAQNGWSDITYE